MAMSQQEVIKKFMASLDKTTQSGTKAINEAIKAATNGKFTEMRRKVIRRKKILKL